jgi:dTDP-4-dehydrorhamnose reductase
MAKTQPLSRPKILLIGAGGQVGWELLRSLRSLGDLVATVHSPSSEPSLRVLPRIDLGDTAALHALVRETRPTIIVNAAAYTAVDKAETERDRAFAINAVAMGVLAAEARECGAAIVHYSTDYVFDGRGDRPWREDDPTGPRNAYGQSKLAGEEAVRSSGVPHLILRTSWVYGIRGQNFVKTMLRLGAQREELRIVSDQIGAPTSARVLADVTSQILAQGLLDPTGFLTERGGIIHVCCRGETSWHGFAEEIFHRARESSFPLQVQRVVPITSADYPTPADRPKNSRLDVTRLREQFRLVPPTWQEALGDSFEALVKLNAAS